LPETITREDLHTPLPAALPSPHLTPTLKQRLVLCDIAAVIGGWAGTLVLGPVLEGAARVGPIDRAGWVAFAVVVNMTLLVAHNLYLARVCSVRATELQGLGRSVLVTAVVLVGAEQALRANLPLREVWLAALITFALLATGRGAFASWLRRHRAAGRFVRGLVLVGADADAIELAAVTREHPELGFRVCGYVGRPGYSDRIRAPHLGDVSQVVRAVKGTNATGVVIIASALDAEVLNQVVRRLLDHGIRVHLSSGLRGIAYQRFRATPLAYEPLFFIEPASLTSWEAFCKRTIDIVGAAIGLVLAAPVLAVAAAAIKIDSPGPVLFRQQRVGRGGELFTFYKLRTMVIGAEARRAELEASNQRSSGPLFKLAADPRVTGVGRLLRATSIDELPQLWNVLRGAMSLVGPRPALPSEVAQFDARLRARTAVPPGLTGLWQIEARDNPHFGPYRRLDLFYVENWSPLLDLEILITTAIRVAERCIWRRRRSPDGAQSASTTVLD
jgi:exopolysaccharide biosynthesis polyprenyl glycosylphosphotransferase